MKSTQFVLFDKKHAQEISFRRTVLVHFKTRVEFPLNKYILVFRLHMAPTRWNVMACRSGTMIIMVLSDLRIYPNALTYSVSFCISMKRSLFFSKSFLWHYSGICEENVKQVQHVRDFETAAFACKKQTENYIAKSLPIL